MALANQFEVKEPQDYLRGLSNVLLEYELFKEDGDRPRMVRPTHSTGYLRDLQLHLSGCSGRKVPNDHPAPTTQYRTRTLQKRI